MAETILDTRLGPMLITRAGEPDVEAVLSILRDATDWLAGRRIGQWEWVRSASAFDVLRARVLTQEVYLIYRERQPVGTVGIGWRDTHCWDRRGEDERAGYLNGLAIRRSVGGHGVGRDLLGWAQHHVARSGRTRVRLDCPAENAELRGYFESLGFVCVGVKDGRGWRACLLERPILIGGCVPVPMDLGLLRA